MYGLLNKISPRNFPDEHLQFCIYLYELFKFNFIIKLPSNERNFFYLHYLKELKNYS